MAPTKRIAVTVGVLYLVTHMTSIGALIVYAPALNGLDHVGASGADARVLFGGLLEIILAMAIVGTAVALFPVVRHEHEGVAFGYSASARSKPQRLSSAFAAFLRW